MSFNLMDASAVALPSSERKPATARMKKSSQVVVDSGLLKQISRQRILNLLHTHKVLSRAEIARLAGLTRSTVTLHMVDLINDGLILEGSSASAGTTIGRPAVPVSLAPEGASFIGADIAIERLSIAKLDLAGNIVSRYEEPIGSDLAPETVLERLATLVRQVNEDGTSNPERLSGVGVTAPALFSLDGTVLAAPRLGWSNVPIRKFLSSRLPWPLFLDNDANASALGETFHSPSGKDQNLLYVLVDTGVGGGVVINGQLYRGSGNAGEIGHLPVSLDGPLCSCGNTGCLEAWIGKQALLQRYEMNTGKRADLDTLIAAAARGDEAVKKVLEDWAVWLGRGLVGLVNVLDPTRLVVGGALSAFLPYVTDHLNHELTRFKWPRRKPIYVEASQHQSFAAAVGGATLAQQSYFDVPRFAETAQMPSESAQM